MEVQAPVKRSRVLAPNCVCNNKNYLTAVPHLGLIWGMEKCSFTAMLQVRLFLIPELDRPTSDVRTLILFFLGKPLIFIFLVVF